MTYTAGFNAGVEAAREKLHQRLADIGGCLDGNCMVVRLKGVHTNGGCQCLKNWTKAQQAVNAYKAFEAEVSTLKLPEPSEAELMPGPVRVWPNDITGHCEILPEGAAGPVIARINPFSARSEAQGWADAHLIAEAFNVHHETGLTPRELAEQRAGLLEAPERLLRRAESLIAAGKGLPFKASFGMLVIEWLREVMKEQTND